jgi:hypothetical protein
MGADGTVLAVTGQWPQNLVESVDLHVKRFFLTFGILPHIRCKLAVSKIWLTTRKSRRGKELSSLISAVLPSPPADDRWGD